METSLGPDTPMQAVLEAFPAARRALFQRYHVGGCSSCAFQPGDTLGELCRDHNILDVDEVIQHILRSDAVDRRLRVDAASVLEWQRAGRPLRLLDLRLSNEREAAPAPAFEAFEFADARRYLELAKDTPFVFLCQDGERALDTAAFFAGHGFTAVHAIAGGAGAWLAAAPRP